jgi:hypothetical protein
LVVSEPNPEPEKTMKTAFNMVQALTVYAVYSVRAKFSIPAKAFRLMGEADRKLAAVQARIAK